MPSKNVYVLNDILDIKNQAGKRKAEECYKLVIKQTFKHLQRVFESDFNESLKNLPESKKIQAFYDYYFGPVARSKNIPIEIFYLPLSIDSKDVKCLLAPAKTINNTYISTISKSKKFVTELFNYIDNRFITDYVMKSRNKLRRQLARWEAVYLTAICEDKAIQSICEFIINNKKSKLPWFYVEAEYACKLTKHIFLKQINEYV